LLQKTGRTAGSGGIETYRNGVWCEVFSVENSGGKNLFGIMILKWNIANMIGFYKARFFFVNIANFLAP